MGKRNTLYGICQEWEKKKPKKGERKGYNPEKRDPYRRGVETRISTEKGKRSKGEWAKRQQARHKGERKKKREGGNEGASRTWVGGTSTHNHKQRYEGKRKGREKPQAGKKRQDIRSGDFARTRSFVRRKKREAKTLTGRGGNRCKNDGRVYTLGVGGRETRKASKERGKPL